MFRIRLIVGFALLSGLSSSLLGQADKTTAPLPPSDFHIELRLAEPRSIYKLGEPISVEFTCYAENPGLYSSECGEQQDIDLLLTPLGNAQTSVSPVQTRWIDFALCESSPGLPTCGLSYDPPPVPQYPVWNRMTLGDREDEAFPMSAGFFQIIARVTVSPKGSSESVMKLSSPPVEVEIIDDARWRSQAFAKFKSKTETSPDNRPYKTLELLPDLEVVKWLTIKEGVSALAEQHPDREAVAQIMRDHLLRTRGFEHNNFKEVFVASLALQLAAESPELYSRAVKFQNEAELSLRDHRDVRAWLAPRYRQLLIDIGKSMSVRKCTRELMEDNDAQQKAEGLIEANTIDCGYKKMQILSNTELRTIMRAACLSPEFIREQLAPK